MRKLRVGAHFAFTPTEIRPPLMHLSLLTVARDERWTSSQVARAKFKIFFIKLQHIFSPSLFSPSIIFNNFIRTLIKLTPHHQVFFLLNTERSNTLFTVLNRLMYDIMIIAGCLQWTESGVWYFTFQMNSIWRINLFIDTTRKKMNAFHVIIADGEHDWDVSHLNVI